MKHYRHIIFGLFTWVMVMVALSSPMTAADNNAKERMLWAFLENGATGESIPDTIFAQLMTPDSIVIAESKITPNTITLETNGEVDGYKTMMELVFKGIGDRFILKLSHPDYADAIFDVEVKGARTDLGTLKMRKPTSFERSRMLSEVTVSASIIQVVNKGDTIQFNADAFAVAKGSMLDALVEQLPGVELRSGGQIYVNGRFVDKMLLDGKDFFKGDQFVLLQNLPAYTVKNLKVYEEASASHEVFGRKSSSDPDLYVMDIILKKGYNSGILANVEAGGGSHSRYRGRGFGTIYNTAFRLGAFAFINNLNESRNPGRNGDWDPAESNAGITTSKGAGVSYGVFRPGRTLEFTGSTSAQYTKTERNTLTNVQNFLSGGDTYSRRWDDALNRNIAFKTSNTLTLRPKEGNKYNQIFYLDADYGNGKIKGNTTEATFGRRIADIPDLRKNLESGWIDGMDALNRFLAASEANTRNFNGHISSVTALSMGSNSDGLRLIASLDYKRSDNRDPDFNNYLVQYAGGKPLTRLRSNPRDSHSHYYILAVEWYRPLGAYFSFRPRIDFYHGYDYNSNPWYADTDSTSAGEMLPSMRADMMMRLDPRNSYTTGLHWTNLRPWLPLSFDKTTYRDGNPYSNISSWIDFKANIRRYSINFDGMTDTRVTKKFVSPSVRVGTKFDFYKMLHSLRIQYEFNGSDFDAFDWIDAVVFDSDPLNLRTGNPDLKQTMSHMARIFYSNSNWMLDRLKMYVDMYYTTIHNQKAMSYAYDRATGVRTYRPVNVNGNRYGEFVVGPTIALTRDKNLRLVDYLKFSPRRSVDMVSYDGFVTSQKSVVNTLYISEYLSLQYNVKKFMAAFDGQIETRRTTSANGYFDPFRVTTYRYGIRGRATLPAGFEINSDIKMYSNRGFEYGAMNTNQLVWNARLTKSFLDGKLMMFVDGYDILGKVKNITYNVNEQGRTETWVNNIPSYVMLSLRWNFAKKPR